MKNIKFFGSFTSKTKMPKLKNPKVKKSAKGKKFVDKFVSRAAKDNKAEKIQKTLNKKKKIIKNAIKIKS